MITQDELKRQLHYCPETGAFTRLVSAHHSVKVGEIAGGLDDAGYWRICINSTVYKAHHLAILYMTGEWLRAGNEVDHMDGVRHNNAWSNLREVSRSVNKQNLRKARADNANRMLGVSRNGSGYVARIWLDGKNSTLGTYRTPEEAHAVYLEAKRAVHEGNTL